MDRESTAAGQSASPRFADIPGVVVWTAFVGLGATLAGFIDGIVLMAKGAPGLCAAFFNGEKTGEFPCTVHPRLGEGLAISAIALSVGALVLLLAYVAAGVVRPDSAPRRSPSAR